jgi:hypothetical protein
MSEPEIVRKTIYSYNGSVVAYQSVVKGSPAEVSIDEMNRKVLESIKTGAPLNPTITMGRGTV